MDALFAAEILSQISPSTTVYVREQSVAWTAIGSLSEVTWQLFFTSQGGGINLLLAMNVTEKAAVMRERENIFSYVKVGWQNIRKGMCGL